MVGSKFRIFFGGRSQSEKLSEIELLLLATTAPQCVTNNAFRKKTWHNLLSMATENTEKSPFLFITSTQDGYKYGSLDRFGFYEKLPIETNLAITLQLGPFEFLEASDRSI